MYNSRNTHRQQLLITVNTGCLLSFLAAVCLLAPENGLAEELKLPPERAFSERCDFLDGTNPSHCREQRVKPQVVPPPQASSSPRPTASSNETIESLTPEEEAEFRKELSHARKEQAEKRANEAAELFLAFFERLSTEVRAKMQEQAGSFPPSGNRRPPRWRQQTPGNQNFRRSTYRPNTWPRQQQRRHNLTATPVAEFGPIVIAIR